MKYNATSAISTMYDGKTAKYNTRQIKSKNNHQMDVFSIKKVVILFIVFAFVILFTNSVIENSKTDWVKNLPRIEYTVVAGDSIDGIASKYHIEGLSDHYFGCIISDINDVDYMLHPGDKLQIPIPSN